MMAPNSPLARGLASAWALCQLAMRVTMYGALALSIVLAAILSAAFGRQER